MAARQRAATSAAEPEARAVLESEAATEAVPPKPAVERQPANRRPPFDLTDIQGNVLRGYGFAHARHFAVEITNKASARRFITGLLPSGERKPLEVATEVEWKPKSPPDYRLNLAFTFAGLGELGVPQGVLTAFPRAFSEGPAKRAEEPDPDFPGAGVGLGDDGNSAPECWELGKPGGPPVHMLISLYTRDSGTSALEELSKELRERFDAAKITEHLARDANALPGGRVHFGYRDGIAQPRIKDAPIRERPDMQPECLPGDFLLGCDYENIYGGNYLGRLPPALGDNATYAAFRILRQEVDKFEDLLGTWQKRYRLPSRDFVAAKLLGRWRNGQPLTLWPGPDEPKPPPADGRQLNSFDYAPADGHTTFFDDLHGRRCPIGAHIRRLNPRSSLVMGRPHSRRLIRRGMPYGPEYDPSNPDDGEERGLVGMFICGDLEQQYEFILRVWANMDLATHGIRGTREPILGDQPEDEGKFVLRTDDARDTVVMTGLPRLVVTRGSVYCFIPGIGGLRYLAGLPGTATAGGGQ